MITDYASLQQAVADWLARADLTAQIPTFVQLAEARFNRDLRLASMQVTRTGTVSSNNDIQLPADCRGVQSLRISTGGLYMELHPLPPERLADTIATQYPIGYVTVGNLLKLVGGSATPTYKVTYYQAIPALASSPSNTNWLLQREPALYLYAALIEASPYIGDDARAQTWAVQYTTTVKGMQAEDDRMRYGNSPAIRSPLRNTP